jgi:hypothetical protein
VLIDLNLITPVKNAEDTANINKISSDTTEVNLIFSHILGQIEEYEAIHLATILNMVKSREDGGVWLSVVGIIISVGIAALAIWGTGGLPIFAGTARALLLGVSISTAGSAIAANIGENEYVAFENKLKKTLREDYQGSIDSMLSKMKSSKLKNTGGSYKELKSYFEELFRTDFHF